MQPTDEMVRAAAEAIRRERGLYGDPPESTLRTARAAIAAALNAMWRPIEEAPKDGTKVIGGIPENCLGVVAHATHKTRGEPWRDHHSLGRVCWTQPTLFMPLPSPPSTDTQIKGG